MKIHNVFHSWLLHFSRRREQKVESSGPIEVDPDGEMEVYYAEVVDSKTFKRRKDKHTGKQGLLKSLPIPEQYWTDISMVFIISLPDCIYGGRKYKHIGVVVCRLSKRKKFLVLDVRRFTAIGALYRVQSLFETELSPSARCRDANWR
jgi:hypothetical protein